MRSTGRLAYKKIFGTFPWDVLPKPVPVVLLDAHLQSQGMEIRGGRSDMTPPLNSVTAECEHELVDPVADDTATTTRTGTRRSAG